MTIHARVAVIGGGIYGCGVLHQLVEKGWHDVVLVEKNELTAGSTWHAAGFCTHYSFNPTHVFMRKFSTELYQRLEAEGNEPTGYHRCRGLRVTSDPDRIEEFKHGASVGRQLGIDFEILSPAETGDVFPLMKTDGVVGSLYEPIDGYVDPTQATQAMAKLARAGGARVLRNSPVLAIERTPDAGWRLHTSNDEIVAEQIVIAAGFWGHEVGAMAGLDLPIVPMLHQYLVTEDHPAVMACEPDSIPLIRHHDQQWYVRRERDGLVLGAYESTPQTWSIDGVPAEFGMELLEPELDRIEHLVVDAIERIPVLGEAGIKTTVHGPISYTPDGQPLLGPAPGLDGVWLACGSGFGIGEGAGAGKLLAEWMVDGVPPMHMLAFDPRRFGDYADRDYRVAKAKEVFALQFATHYPLEEREAGRPRKQTAIVTRLASAGARFGCVYGWERANWFATAGEPHELSFRRTAWFDAVARECQAVTEHAGVIDLSGFSKFELRGPDAEPVLDRLSANRLPARTGDIRLCHFLNHKGTVECEFTITRTGERTFYLVCAAIAERHHLDYLRANFPRHADLVLENMSTRRGVLGLAGPASRDVLQPFTDTSLDDQTLPWLGARELQVAGVDVLALRVSYTGELGYELHHHADDQLVLYEALTSGVGREVQDFGFYALNAMRMEKAYKAWGTELTVENTAGELGLERFVRTKDRDFIGRDAVLKERAQGVTCRLVYGALSDADRDPIGGDAVMSDDELVGVAFGGSYGHRVGKSLCFALVNCDVLESGCALEVECCGERRALTPLGEPAFDAENLRPTCNLEASCPPRR